MTSLNKSSLPFRGSRQGPTSNLKPLVAATGLALLSMAAGNAFATACTTTTVSTTQSIGVTLPASQCLVVSSTGSLDVTGASPAVTATGQGSSITVQAGGRITASSLAGSGAAIYHSATDAESTLTISNSGMIAGQGYAINRATNTGVVVSNAATGQIVGAISATSINNFGAVTLKTGVDLGNIANTGGVATAVLNTYTGESGSALNIAVVSNTSYSYLQAANSNLTGESTLNVDVKGGQLSNGASLRVIRASSTASGNFTTVNDNSALFNFVATAPIPSGVNSGNFIQAQRVATIEQLLGGDGFGRQAAQVLDQMGYVLPGATAQEVQESLKQTLPLLTGGSLVAGQNALNGINRVIQSRTEGNQGMSSGDGFLGDQYVWMKPFGSWANQKDDNGVPGFDANTYGLAIGADGAYSKTTRLGVAFAYAKSDIDGKAGTAKQSADVDVFQLVGYGTYALDPRTEINFQVDAGRNSTDGKRHIDIVSPNLVAKSSYDSTSAHAGVGIARQYPISDKDIITASTRADYTWIKDDSYTEKGAGGLNLAVKSRDVDALILAVDGKLTHTVDPSTQFLANLGVGYDTLNDRSSIVSAYAGAPTAQFTTYGNDPSPWMLRAGFGVVHKTEKGTEITARYDGEAREKFTNQTASVKMRWAF